MSSPQILTPEMVKNLQLELAQEKENVDRLKRCLEQVFSVFLYKSPMNFESESAPAIRKSVPPPGEREDRHPCDKIQI